MAFVPVSWWYCQVQFKYPINGGLSTMVVASNEIDSNEEGNCHVILSLLPEQQEPTL